MFICALAHHVSVVIFCQWFLPSMRVSEKEQGGQWVNGVLPFEARRADSEGGALGEWVQGRAPAAHRFFSVLWGFQAAYFATLFKGKQLQKSLSLAAKGVVPTPWGQNVHEHGVINWSMGVHPLTPCQLAPCFSHSAGCEYWFTVIVFQMGLTNINHFCSVSDDCSHAMQQDGPNTASRPLLPLTDAIMFLPITSLND